MVIKVWKGSYEKEDIMVASVRSFVCSFVCLFVCVFVLQTLMRKKIMTYGGRNSKWWTARIPHRMKYHERDTWTHVYLKGWVLSVFP